MRFSYHPHRRPKTVVQRDSLPQHHFRPLRPWLPRYHLQHLQPPHWWGVGGFGGFGGLGGLGGLRVWGIWGLGGFGGLGAWKVCGWVVEWFRKGCGWVVYFILISFHLLFFSFLLFLPPFFSFLLPYSFLHLLHPLPPPTRLR